MGIPQLSMHSIREMCGVDDVGIAYRHLLAFFQVGTGCKVCGGLEGWRGRLGAR